MGKKANQEIYNFIISYKIYPCSKNKITNKFLKIPIKLTYIK